MLKFLITAGFLCTLSMGAGAQGAHKTDYPENPFQILNFSRGPTDTLTLIVNYAGNYGKLSDGNVSLIDCINKVHKLNVKKFDYAIAFKLDGYSTSFYVPCKDKSIINILSAKSSAVSKLKINCVVYRFFYLDGICNFFYIDKAALLEHGI
ncbi:MAG: hypothetical protein JWQ84_2842 [Mucilaginibacter sp.]|nr:hypothetical protein [Mucilaginibacter sp.]MDB5018010.1 hypothetical protein [Mucilaginibacter sp.]